MSEIGFSHPWLLLLALVPLLLPMARLLPSLRLRGLVSISTYDWMPSAAASPRYAQWFADALRILAILCLTLIAAGVRSGKSIPVIAESSEALVVVLDVSSSMTAEDFAPGNRLEVAKVLLTEFATSHSNSDLGLILLAASPRLMVPITADAGALPSALRGVRPAGYEEDGTAIGSGIASAINRLRGGPWEKRRILLVTDGVNNRGALAPTDAARIAASLGIRIDTIGIGTDSISRYWAPSAEGSPVEVKARIQIDDKALEEVSKITGGKYSRVTNSEELRRVLRSMDAAGKNAPVPTVQPDFSWVRFLAGGSILLIVIEFVLTRFVCPELPD